MAKLSILTTLARERLTRAVRTARALADMAAHVLDWERAHRALVAAEHPHSHRAPGDSPAPPTSGKRAGAERANEEGPGTVGAAPAASVDGAPPRFRDTIAASHAPRIDPLASTLGPDDTLVSIAAPALEAGDRQPGTRASH